MIRKVALLLILALHLNALAAFDLFNQNTGAAQAISTYNASWVIVRGAFLVQTGNIGEWRSSAAVGNNYNIARRSGLGFSDHQESIVRATTAALAGGYLWGPAVRCQSGAITCYFVGYNPTQYYVIKIVADVDVTLTGGGSGADNFAVTVAAGDDVKLTAETIGGNTQLKVYKNTVAAPTVWTQQNSTYTDASSPITGGDPGIFGYGDVSSSGFGGGRWEANDLGAAGPSTPPSGVLLRGNGK